MFNDHYWILKLYGDIYEKGLFRTEAKITTNEDKLNIYILTH